MKTHFLIGFLALFLLLGTTQAVDITDCSSLDAADTYYSLTANISNSPWNVCMNVTAANVTLDCNGGLIDGVATASTLGVFVNSTQDFTLRNCFVSDWGTDVYVNASNNTNLSNNFIYGSQLWAGEFYNTFNTTIQDNQIGGIQGDTSPYRFNRRLFLFQTVDGDNADNDKIYFRRNVFLNKTAGMGSFYGNYFDCNSAGAASGSCNHAHEIIWEYNNVSGFTGSGTPSFIYIVANYSNFTFRFNNFNQPTSTNYYVFKIEDPYALNEFGEYIIYNNTFTRQDTTSSNSYVFVLVSANASLNFSNNALVWYDYSIVTWDYEGGQGLHDSTIANNSIHGGGFYGSCRDCLFDGNSVNASGLANNAQLWVYDVVGGGDDQYSNEFTNNYVEGASVSIFVAGTNPVVRNNTLTQAGGSGIQIQLGTNALVYNNTVWNTASEGVYLDGSLGGVDVSNANVSYNVLHDVLDSCIYGDVANSFYQNNVCFNSELEGLWVSAAYSTETNNTITYNTVWNSTSGIAGRLHNSNVSYNNVSNCTRDNGAGIHVKNDGGFFTGNNVFNNTYGYLVNGSSDLKIYGNNVSYNLINYAFDCNHVFGSCRGYSYGNQIVDTVIQSNSSGTLDFTLDYNSQVTLVNTTFNKSAVSFKSGSFFGAPAVSNLTVKWYVYLLVVDNTSDPFGAAYANISNTQNNRLLYEFFNETTNSTGFTPRLNVTEYFQNSTGVYNFTPHNASGSWYGLSVNYSTGYITNATIVTIVLTPVTAATSTSGNLPTTFNLVTQVILSFLMIVVVFLMLFVAFERQEFKLLFLLLALTTITVIIYVVSSAVELNSITTTLYNAGWIEQKHEVSNSTFELNEGSQNTFVTLFSGWNWVLYFILALIYINLVKEAWEYFESGKRKKNAVF